MQIAASTSTHKYTSASFARNAAWFAKCGLQARRPTRRAFAELAVSLFDLQPLETVSSRRRGVKRDSRQLDRGCRSGWRRMDGTCYRSRGPGKKSNSACNSGPGDCSGRKWPPSIGRPTTSRQYSFQIVRTSGFAAAVWLCDPHTTSVGIFTFRARSAASRANPMVAHAR